MQLSVAPATPGALGAGRRGVPYSGTRLGSQGPGSRLGTRLAPTTPSPSCSPGGSREYSNLQPTDRHPFDRLIMEFRRQHGPKTHRGKNGRIEEGGRSEERGRRRRRRRRALGRHRHLWGGGRRKTNRVTLFRQVRKHDF